MRSWSSTTRGSCPPGSRSSSRMGRCSCSSRSATGSGRRSPDRPGVCARDRRYGPVELLEHLGEGRWRVRLDGEPAGETPLPPYITEPLADPERYQTVYAREAGSAAAPTAGLHFTPELLARLDVERVTLHVGLDTFRPVSVDDLAEHVLHGERYEVSAAAWERIRSAPRVLAVGTTTVRVLETLARGGPLSGRTDLFVTPGFEFRRVDALLTNFHLPRSTLLALVMAFAGVEETSEAVRAGDRRAVPLLLLRRRHARNLNGCTSRSPRPTAPRARASSAPPTATSRHRRSCPSGRRRPSRACTRTRCARAGARILLGNTYHLHFRPGRGPDRRSSAGCTRSWAGTGRS